MPTVSATQARWSGESSAPSGLASSFSANDPGGAEDRFVQQALQPNGIAGAGLERPAVLAQHGAEADVLKLDLVVAQQPGRGEKLLEVQALAVIDDIQDGVGPPLLHAIADRGQIGRGVQVCPVLLLHDHRRRLAFEEHANRPLALAGDAPATQLLDHARQHVVIIAFAQRVIEVDVQAAVDPLDIFQAIGHELLPQPVVLGIASMKFGRLGLVAGPTCGSSSASWAGSDRHHGGNLLLALDFLALP